MIIDTMQGDSRIAGSMSDGARFTAQRDSEGNARIEIWNTSVVPEYVRDCVTINAGKFDNLVEAVNRADVIING